MRLRNVKGSFEKMDSSNFVIKDIFKGEWSNKLFKNNNPIHIEIGTGKGKFITELAKRNPNINYIGIEKFSSVLIRAVEKQELENLPNLYFLRIEAENICEYFDNNEIEKIYLNFSDPWPKDRHAKRRLTSKNFFNKYNIILSKNGEVCFKTDNIDLFKFSLEEIPDETWKLKDITYDLHNSEYNKNNIMTEYEIKFSEKGIPINRLVAYR